MRAVRFLMARAGEIQCSWFGFGARVRGRFDVDVEGFAQKWGQDSMREYLFLRVF